MDMMKRILVTAFFAGMVGTMGVEAMAQGPSDLANLEREIENTQVLIQRAADMARDAGNAQAAELVKKAQEVQHQARQSFGNGRFEAARIMTTAARKLAAKAISLMQNPDARGDRVQAELERTDDLLSRAREHLEPSSPESARTFLAAAHRQQEQAWQLFRSSEIRPALRMTLQVREMLRKLAARLGDNNTDRIEALLKRTEDLVGQANDAALAGGNQAALRLAGRATEMLNRAKEFIAQGRAQAAKRHLEQAGNLARQSLRQGENGAPSLEDAARRYEAMFDQVRDMQGQTENPAVERLMGESREHFNLALELAASVGDNNTQALAEMRLAHRLLQQAREILR